ncbi:MAG: hypothetical protein ACFFCD_18070 [Promethearchaeota archaeon]
MVKKRWYVLILLANLIAAMIYGLIIETSLSVFLSWLAVGFWMCFTLAFLNKVKYAREFRSPHNTSFFVFGPLFIGILYSLWGRSNGLLRENLLESSMVYLSPWTLIFAFSYLMYGIFIIYSCFRRYTVVYIGQKSFSARKFGFFLSFLTTIIGFYCALAFFPSLMFWLLGIISLLLLIVFGIFGGRTAIPDVSTVVTNIRRQIPGSSSAGNTTDTTTTTTRRRSPTITTTTTTTRRRSPTNTTATTTTTATTKITRSTPPTTKKKTSTTITATTAAVTTPRKKAKRKKKPKMSAKFKELKPTAELLSLDDFKCIFCFQEFKSEDKGRGVVLCPHCRYPAHADEFNDWLKNSTLCSRCDANIPAGFRRNPKIIPVKDYIEIVNEFKHRYKK